MTFDFLKNFGFIHEPFPKESKLGNKHTFITDGGAEYDVYKLVHLTQETQPIKIKITDIENKIFVGVWWSDNNERKFSPKDLLDEYDKIKSWKEIENAHPEWKDHIKKVLEADYTHPILMHRDYVLDGMHRLIKAITEKVDCIPVKVLDQLPEEAKL